MNEKITKIISLAENLIGTPYHYGASTSDQTSFDCSSFIQYIFKTGAEIELPRSAILQAGYEQGQEIDPSQPENFQPGDLLFMRGSQGHYRDEFFNDRPIDIGHVALFIGNDEIIHSAGGEKNKVIKESAKQFYKKINFVKRFII
ncbi:MAG: hypothetical protein A2607_01770 [Candidatus Vogelbacteria bacterium RIFOXYD1_FULL_42_15]|uniref:NlpC/P60 domain-containing protein n=1 Tax=Candidatus Vogelbacteria bacterium RIFOXYD1_FULL_42_15 TaxID=1802437 RepID=A0A1G2QI01_9BACT|nr:MAG: hypothetical protein A2607_01770 [Candidatus Vogelbacteria bacterium RIFOXYD1_FULL_42_15]